MGKIHSIETFGTVDGPGVRFVVFFQGCPMRCAYCHNPDTWEMDGGTEVSAEELIARLNRNRAFYKTGGITATGGEPLLQIDFLLEFFRLAKEKGIHTALDTSGNPFTTEEPFYFKWKELMQYTDLVLLDIKHIDEAQHRILTGCTNENILEMARQLSDLGKTMWIRHVLVPERNDKDEYLTRLAEFLKTLKTVERVEVLPYHTLGIYKWENLGITYPLDGIEPPSEERVKNAERILGEGMQT